MTPQTQAYALFFAVAALSGVLIAGMGWMIKALINKGKSWIVVLDDSGIATVKRRRITGVVTTIKPRKGDGRAWTLDGRARYTTTNGPLYMVHGNTGQSLMAPTMDEYKGQLQGMEAADEVAHDAESRRPRMTREFIQKLLTCDPFFTFNQLATNSYKKWHSTQEGKEDWRVKVAPLALIAVLFLVVVLGIVVVKMQKGGV